MKIIFINQCCVDGCYKKRAKSQFCKQHEKDLCAGKIISVNYGKKITKNK
jgi:hypothetical protein